MTAPPRVTFLVDVDNTLIDNDAAKTEIGHRLEALLGAAETGRFWRIYEQVRAEAGVVSYPLTLARFHEETGLSSAGDEAPAATRDQRFALADLVVAFPYADFLYPQTAETLAHLGALGRVAILSDGDPTYQPTKIARAGLDAMVDGFVFVYPHKELYLREVTAALPADHYVLVEDKPDNLTKVKERLAAPLTRVLVQQGKYAAAAGPGPWSGADITVERLGGLMGYDAAAFVAAGSPPMDG